MRESAKEIVPWVVVGISFAFVGWFIGWYSGASQSPVGAAILPVIIGLLVASTALAVPGAASVKDIVKGKPTATDSYSEKEKTTSPWRLAGWCVAVAVFSLSCYLGVEAGIERRVPELRSVRDMVGNVTTSPMDMAELQVLRFHLRTIGATRADVEEVFSTTIAPLLADNTGKNPSPNHESDSQTPSKFEESVQSDAEQFGEPETELFPERKTLGYTPLARTAEAHNDVRRSALLTSIVNRFLGLREYRNPMVPTSANGHKGDY